MALDRIGRHRLQRREDEAHAEGGDAVAAHELGLGRDQGNAPEADGGDQGTLGDPATRRHGWVAHDHLVGQDLDEADDEGGIDWASVIIGTAEENGIAVDK